MKTTLAHDVAAWLRGMENCRDARPCIVTIGKQQWQAAQYHDTAHDGRTPRLYLVGELPAGYRRRKKTCFPFADGGEWFVAAYMPAEILKEENRSYHPFGANVLLLPWAVPNGSKIDAYQDKPYSRTPMHVQYLDY